MKQVNQTTIEEYLAEAEEILDNLGEELLNLEQSASEGDADPEVVNAIFRAAHSLKGISAMFGFDDITEVAHKLETLLDGIRMGRVPCSRPILDILFEGLDVIKGLCSNLSAGGSGTDPTVKNFVEKVVAAAEGRIPGEDGEEEEEPLEPKGLARLDLPEEMLKALTDYEIHRLEANLEDHRKTLASVFVTMPIMTLDTDMEKLNALVKPIGEIISTMPAMGEIKPDELDFQLLVSFKVGIEEADKAVSPLGARVAPLMKPSPARAVKARREKAPEPVRPKRETLKPPQETEEGRDLAEIAVPEQPVPRYAREPERERGDGDLRSMGNTIRVDLTKLDILMNLVGELVLTKGRFISINERLREGLGFTGEVLEMAKAQKELERRLGELQQAVMEVRMVPMGQLFSKLHRAVRKIIQGSEKKVNLEISGSDTQLDKLIVEDLSDPLIHVIRNAVDHGIETPDMREAMGKPPEGVVTISASQKGNYVIIEVTDDGAGIDIEKVRNKALRLGLMGPDEILEKKKLLDFVFMPGFSTRDQVSEISGRGVGMDVLRRNIANISGIIELETEKGLGTTIKIIMPITLAIIQALLIEASGETYAIPLNTVVETVVVEQDKIKFLEGRPMLHLRDMTLPLVDVGSFFDDRCGIRSPPYAVVVGIAEKRVAFGVDGLLTQRDVVIKSLGSRLAGIRGISGATDLGDSRTVLILDIARMIDEIYESI